MEVRDVMSAPPVTIEPSATLADAVSAMLAEDIGSVVIADLAPVGIVTRTDVLQAMTDGSVSLETVSISAVMTADPVTIHAGASLEAAVEAMESHHIKRLPVIEDLELVGIVTMTDIARQLPERVQEVKATIDRKERWSQ